MIHVDAAGPDRALKSSTVVDLAHAVMSAALRRLGLPMTCTVRGI
jgi:hypothetical protein